MVNYRSSNPSCIRYYYIWLLRLTYMKQPEWHLLWIERSHGILFDSEYMVLDYEQVGIPYRVRSNTVVDSRYLTELLTYECVCLGGRPHHWSPSARCWTESGLTQSIKPDTLWCIRDQRRHQEHPPLHLHDTNRVCVGLAGHRRQPHLLRQLPPELALQVGRLAGHGGVPLEPPAAGRQSVPSASAEPLATSHRGSQILLLRQSPYVPSKLCCKLNIPCRILFIITSLVELNCKTTLIRVNQHHISVLMSSFKSYTFNKKFYVFIFFWGT